MKRLNKYILVCVAMLCLVACHTQKTTTRIRHRITAEQQLAQKVIAAQPVFQTAEASKVRVGITYAGQKISINGSVSIITDSLMVLSIQPLLGIEMYRIELTPQCVMLIDKMSRKYVQSTYVELAERTGMPLTFRDIQAVFINRMFVVGKEQSDIAHLPFTSAATDTEHRLVLQDQMLHYTFGVEPQTYALTSTQTSVGNALAKVEYTNHQLQDEVYFPQTFLFSLNDGQNNITECELTLLKVRFNQPLNIRTLDLKRYSQTTLNKLLSI